MKTFAIAAAALLACADTALAHYRWTDLVANGTKTADYQFVRQNTNYNSPVTDVMSNDIRCNVGTSGANTQVATVQAGSTIGMALDQAIYHPGGMNMYMSKAPGDVKSYAGDGKWFKVAQMGATFGAGTISWPANGMTQWTFKLPASTPSGQYLLRVEHIAVHAASSVGGAQFYISCAQINVVGGGNGNPGPTISLPGGYSATDPGILININYPVPTSYKNPGPAVWTG